MLNTLYSIMQHLDLVTQMIDYFELSEQVKLLNVEFDYSVLEIKKAIQDQVFEVLIDILIDDFQQLKAEGIIYGNNFQDRMSAYQKNLESKQCINYLVGKYPLLKSILEKNIKDLLILMRDVHIAFQEDREDIQTVFSIKESKILSMEFSLGDKHNDKSVVKIKTSKSELFYKPRCLMTDVLYNQILEYLQKIGNIDFLFPKVLVKTKYSWQESIPVNQNLTLDEAKRFYYRAGFLLAIFNVLRGTDIHFENLIVCGEYPVVIDTETIMSPTDYLDLSKNNGKSVDQSVISTSMLPVKDSLYDVNVSSLFYRVSTSKTLNMNILVEDSEVDFKNIEVPVQTEICSNVVLVDNLPVDYQLIKESLENGLVEALNLFKDFKKDFLEIISKFLGKKVLIRKILRGTQVYYTFLKELRKPEALSDFSKRDKIFNILLKNFTPSSYGYLRVEKEIEDLSNQNVPYFYTYLESKNLYSKNAMVCKNYFQNSAFDNVKHSLDCLTDDMIAYQKHMLNISLAMEFSSEENMNNIFIKSDDSSINDMTDRFPEELLRREIISDEINGGVFYVLEFEGKELKISHLSPGLYMGGGLAHYLCIFAYVNEDEKIREFVKRILMRFYDDFIALDESEYNHNVFSVYQGYGSLLYLLYNYDILFQDELIKRYFYNILGKVISYLEKVSYSGIDYDFINGYGAMMYLLSSLSSRIPINQNNKAKLEGILDKYVSYVLQTQIKEIGFAHGISGIAASLVKIFSITNNMDLLKYLKDLIIFEDSLLKDNFSDIDFSWCRGIGGMILARAIILRELKKTTNTLFCTSLIENSLSQLLDEKYLSKIHSQNGICLCHGRAGTIEILKFLKDSEIINLENLMNTICPNYNEVEKFEWFHGVRYSFESFMLGRPGVNYSILGLQTKVPSILALEI